MCQIGCYISAALLILLLLKDLEFSHGKAGRQKCYYHPIAASENIRIDYQVIHGGHGKPHINFNLMDPSRSLLVNTISLFNTKIVAFTLEVTPANKRQEMLTDCQFDLAYTSIYSYIDKIRVNVLRLRQSQDFISTIKARDRHVAESNYERVIVWSSAQHLAMIVVGCLQVVMLRSIFSTNGRLAEFLKRF